MSPIREWIERDSERDRKKENELERYIYCERVKESGPESITRKS